MLLELGDRVMKHILSENTGTYADRSAAVVYRARDALLTEMAWLWDGYDE